MCTRLVPSGKVEVKSVRIVQITPSAGDQFYCENCLRDVGIVAAMRRLGHDVVMVPLYLPLQSDAGGAESDAPIFFGGVNVYLQQKSALFRKTPRWIDRWFDSPRLLHWMGRKAETTSAQGLGEMTMSMLRGEHGRQAKELNRLVEWLGLQDNRPDVVCLSNVLLAGLAGRIKEELGVPIVCLLQDEDEFLDGLDSPYAEQAWEMLARRCAEVDVFISPSRYYANAMAERLNLAADRVHVVYMGIALDGYELSEGGPEAPTIGYLSRMCRDRGLDTLVDAFTMLKRNERLKDVRLRVAGGKRGDDEVFLSRIQQQLDSCGLIDDVEFLPDFDRHAKLAFLRSLTVLSVPEKQPIAYGLYMLEALAAGVPVVEPAHGVFPELLEMTGGGVLCEPNNAGALASAIEPLLLDSDHARELGKHGRERVFEKFNVDQTAVELVRIYEGIGSNR
jgi:glycosyltransferase involved in cell wall biosynthesis